MPSEDVTLLHYCILLHTFPKTLKMVYIENGKETSKQGDEVLPRR
jgi:hypothetical protein